MLFDSAPDPSTRRFLPDFCANPTVFLTVLLAELFALVLALSEADRLGDFWNRLALISLFVQWVVLGAAAVLCLSQRYLARLGPVAATLAVLGLTQGVTLGFSLLGGWFLQPPAEVTAPAVPLALIVARNLAISSIITLMALRYFYVRRQWQQQVEAEAQARLQALQARIHPHFLFNTLNTIASLIPHRPAEAEQAVLDLADLLRSALGVRRDLESYYDLVQINGMLGQSGKAGDVESQIAALEDKLAATIGGMQTVRTEEAAIQDFDAKRQELLASLAAVKAE